MSRKMTDTARKLLSDNESDYLYGDIGITHQEGLYSTVTHKRLLEFLKTYPVYSVTIGKNNYGEFQFIYCKVKRTSEFGHTWDDCLTFWGNGYNDCRDVLQVTWSFDVGNAFMIRDKSPMTKKEVLSLINERRSAVGIGKDTKQETSGNLFEFLADLTDEDAAYSELYG